MPHQELKPEWEEKMMEVLDSEIGYENEVWYSKKFNSYDEELVKPLLEIVRTVIQEAVEKERRTVSKILCAQCRKKLVGYAE